MLLSGNHSSSEDNSIQGAIEEALANLFEEQYSLELEYACKIDEDFFMRVAQNYIPMVTNDEKVIVCIKILLQKIFK